MELFKRLKVTIPIEVWDEIIKSNDVNQVDNLVSTLLINHYRLEIE